VAPSAKFCLGNETDKHFVISLSVYMLPGWLNAEQFGRTKMQSVGENRVMLIPFERPKPPKPTPEPPYPFWHLVAACAASVLLLPLFLLHDRYSDDSEAQELPPAQEMQALCPEFILQSLMIALIGILSFLAMLLSPQTALTVLGWLFIGRALAGLIGPFSSSRPQRFWLSLSVAAVSFAAGLTLIGWPINVTKSVGPVLLVFLAVQGASNLLQAPFGEPELNDWRWNLFAGSAQLGLALAIFFGVPGSQVAVLAGMAGCAFLVTAAANMGGAFRAHLAYNTSLRKS